jgi:hypothetical protein
VGTEVPKVRKGENPGRKRISENQIRRIGSPVDQRSRYFGVSKPKIEKRREEGQNNFQSTFHVSTLRGSRGQEVEFLGYETPK